MSRARHATYRLQLHAGFGFDAAAGIADYLAALGVSHVYTSPYLQAAPGSKHGYDVVDHTRVNAELGGDEGHARFLAALVAAGLGHVVDVVPNHMAIASRENQWWWDVLKRGPASAYARYFDVDWDPPEQRLRNAVLLPVLADHYGRVLEAGEIRLWREGPDFTIRYGEHVFPVAPESVEGLGDDDAVARVNASPDALDALLEQQHYRLAWWQSAQRDLGYRRFFDVNSLIGLRVEDESVFRETHDLVLRWMTNGDADGLRIDHPDGLKDPERYLERLAEACPGCYVVVEKVLGAGERLPDSWPVAGTTGYDFLNLVNGLFVDPAAAAPLTACYEEFTGQAADFAAVARAMKLQALRETLGSDVRRLGELLLQVCERHRRHRDYTRHHLTDALFELLACFPVYRSYARPAGNRISDADRAHIEEAMRRARGFRPDLDGALLEFIHQVLTLQVGGRMESEFVLQFQQLCAPAMAKGIEDGAFYTYNRFVALNEVGGDPSRFGVTPAEFHAAMDERQAKQPLTMNATDTHDAKRGEDVRARLSLLTQMPGEWQAAVRRWSTMNERHGTDGMPDRNAEYLLYQTLVGAWPISVDRVQAYMEKASREAKAHTSWVAPNAAYEAAMRGFVDGIFGSAEFTADLETFVSPLVEAGHVVSLAQLLLKLTAPGVPDIYQGTELWAHTLVDPDNRRPVDFDARRASLEEVGGKAWMIRCALSIRRRHAEAFGERGSYVPLAAEGPMAEHVVAFARGGEVITVVPRLVGSHRWDGTVLALPAGGWRNVFTGEDIGGTALVKNLLEQFPVALLERRM